MEVLTIIEDEVVVDNTEVTMNCDCNCDCDTYGCEYCDGAACDCRN